MKNQFLAIIASATLISCSQSSGKEKTNTPADTSAVKIAAPSTPAPSPAIKADAATIMARKQVPVLCYHHIREIQMASKANKGYEVTIAQFKQQMKTLADSGYKSITPEEYYNYLTKGTALPEKPVMITFDDTSEEHFTIAKPEMEKYGFKGVYFIMTISIGRPRYMTKEQIKQLSDDGHVIASHTWDHHRVDKYIVGDRTVTEGKKQKTVNDWDVQLAGSKTKLEEITGKTVEYFAYPFGIWSKSGIPEIEKRGYKMAFQLSTVRDSLQPLYTVRRMIVSPEWSAPGMVKVMKSTFR
ncbi:MAG TPA: polysaccharide deacetylase family protein [Flavisolibacter sp.]|nr:polysaccharide deacetylase family protein [Flavisolibacter sp.]